MSTIQHSPIKWIICEDMRIFREGIKNALSKYPDLEFMAEAANGQELLDILNHFTPDIVLLNIQMPVLDGIQTMPLIQRNFPWCKVIVFSFLNDAKIVRKMMEYGARCYVTKESGGEAVYKAMIEVHQHGFFINRQVYNSLINGYMDA